MSTRTLTHTRTSLASEESVLNVDCVLVNKKPKNYDSVSVEYSRYSMQGTWPNNYSRISLAQMVHNKEKETQFYDLRTFVLL